MKRLRCLCRGFGVLVGPYGLTRNVCHGCNGSGKYAAQGMSAGTAKTRNEVEGEARQPGREAMCPNAVPPLSDKEKD